MAQGHPPAAAMASYRRSRLPFARPQTLQKSAQLRRDKVPQQTPTRATPAGKSHHKATAMAQGHPPAAAMASYRRSRLPFARPQTLQTLQKSAQLGREKVPQQAQHAPRPQAKATTRPQEWLKGTPRPQQWLLIGVQGCRLPGLKPSKRSKSPPSSAGKGTPTSPTRATPARKSQHKATAMAEGHPPAAAMASYRRSRLPFARPQTFQTSKSSKRPPNSASKSTPTSPTGPTPGAKATTRLQQWLKGTPRPQQ